jgi:hypothetical protein
MGAELSPSSDKRAVLVGEDEVLQLMSCGRSREAGFHVVQAANAAQALKSCRAGYH